MNQKEEKELVEMFTARLQGYRETTAVSFKAGLLRDLLHLAKRGQIFCDAIVELEKLRAKSGQS